MKDGRGGVRAEVAGAAAEQSGVANLGKIGLKLPSLGTFSGILTPLASLISRGWKNKSRSFQCLEN